MKILRRLLKDWGNVLIRFLKPDFAPGGPYSFSYSNLKNFFNFLLIPRPGPLMNKYKLKKILSEDPELAEFFKENPSALDLLLGKTLEAKNRGLWPEDASSPEEPWPEDRIYKDQDGSNNSWPEGDLNGT